MISKNISNITACLSGLDYSCDELICFSMYFNYGKNYAICNAYLLRELVFIEEFTRLFRFPFAAENGAFEKCVLQLLHLQRCEKNIRP